MKERSHSNVKIVMQLLIKNEIRFESVHDGKKTFKCEDCLAVFHQKGTILESHHIIITLSVQRYCIHICSQAKPELKLTKIDSVQGSV